MRTHCPDIERELAAFCSGELDVAVQESVRIHLDGCVSCRDELAREMDLRKTMASLPTTGAPIDLEAGIWNAIHQEKAPARNFGKRWAAAVALAAASLALALLIPATRSGPPREPDFSAQEIAAARQDVEYTLALTARVFDRTSKSTVIEVFGDKLPQAINESFKTMKPNTPGGNG